jgi:hypothetical protein
MISAAGGSHNGGRLKTGSMSIYRTGRGNDTRSTLTVEELLEKQRAQYARRKLAKKPLASVKALNAEAFFTLCNGTNSPKKGKKKDA